MTALERPEGWVPEFPGQRPPFGTGNQVALKYGAYSPKRVDARAEVVVHQLLEQPDVAFLRAPEYRAALWRYAQRQARADLLHAFLVEHGEECHGCERCESWERRWRELDTAAAKASERLGLDPLSRAKLGKDVAQGRQADAAAVMAELHRLEREGRLPQAMGGEGQ